MKVFGLSALIFLAYSLPSHASDGPQPVPKATKPGQGISESTKKQLEVRKNLEQQTLSDEDLSALFQQHSNNPETKKQEAKPAQKKKSVLSFFKRK